MRQLFVIFDLIVKLEFILYKSLTFIIVVNRKINIVILVN